jgi:leucyl/phenylalanyl-tRNA--protein transferase
MPAVLGPDPIFPPVDDAMRDPDGLLAIGGDLSLPRLLAAYRHGIFPWFSAGQPILWWSPDPRMVFRTDGVHLSTRFRRVLRSSEWIVRADTRFSDVIDACATIKRDGQRGTWILPAMRRAYVELHQRGHAHSIEVFDGDGERLVGGLYGVAIGAMFFAESMYSAESGGSKVALAALAHRLHAWGWPLIDAQVENDHLVRMGAELMPRKAFMDHVATQVAIDDAPGPWTARFCGEDGAGRADLRASALAG